MLETLNFTIIELGGVSLLVTGLSAWLGKIWSGKILVEVKADFTKELEEIKSKNVLTTEQYKVQLKKSEFFFEKQFEASLEFWKFFYNILPKKQSVMDEWEDAMIELADDLDTHQNYIDTFISKYNILFSNNTLKLLQNASNQVVRMNDNKEMHDMNEHDEQSWHRKKWDYADDFYTEIKKANESIRNEVMGQVKI